MAEYIKREDAMKALDEYRLSQTMSKFGDWELLMEYRDGVIGAMNALAFVPTADVVPKSAVERLEREVRLLTENTITAKYSHCVIGSYYAVLTKSLEDYEKVIADISSAAKAEVAREIFAEIERKSCVISETNHSTGSTRVVCYQISAEKLAELKKKYTEGE